MQSPAHTLALKSGSCRDMATLMLEAARHLGVAARFSSGYLHSSASRAGRGTTHAWTEVYLPTLGWRGFDPTRGNGRSPFRSHRRRREQPSSRRHAHIRCAFSGYQAWTARRCTWPSRPRSCLLLSPTTPLARWARVDEANLIPLIHASRRLRFIANFRLLLDSTLRSALGPAGRWRSVRVCDHLRDRAIDSAPIHGGQDQQGARAVSGERALKLPFSMRPAIRSAPADVRQSSSLSVRNRRWWPTDTWTKFGVSVPSANTSGTRRAISFVFKVSNSAVM